MRNLISFIIKNVHWLLFLLLVFISLYMIVNNNAYQRSKYLVVEREVVGNVYNISNKVFSYLGLKKANSNLLEKIAELETRNLYLENYISEYNLQLKELGIRDSMIFHEYDFSCARVVNSNISGLENLITLNKGSSDNVKPDMAVLSSEGVVGIIMSVSENFSVVIPILNSKSQLSCMIKSSGYYGSLAWNGKDSRFVNMIDLPRHAEFEVGDTVVTGFSEVFPQGILIGVVEDSKRQKDDNLNTLNVRLFTDFSNLKEVMIVDYKFKNEQKTIEQEAIKRISRVGSVFNGN